MRLSLPSFEMLKPRNFRSSSLSGEADRDPRASGRAPSPPDRAAIAGMPRAASDCGRCRAWPRRCRSRATDRANASPSRGQGRARGPPPVGSPLPPPSPPHVRASSSSNPSPWHPSESPTEHSNLICALTGIPRGRSDSHSIRNRSSETIELGSSNIALPQSGVRKNDNLIKRSVRGRSEDLPVEDEGRCIATDTPNQGQDGIHGRASMGATDAIGSNPTACGIVSVLSPGCSRLHQAWTTPVICASRLQEA
jgi:hypothetical protein